MSEKLNELGKLASENEQLAQELQELNKKFENEIVTETIAIAGKHGLVLEESDFAPDEDLSVEELDSIAGGVAVCVLIGFGKSELGDATLCKYVGFGL